MFRQNAQTPQNLSAEQKDNSYFFLYYQFVKTPLACSRCPTPDIGKRPPFFDDLPDNQEKRQQFKGYVLGLASNREILARQIVLVPDNISEVKSHDHVLLQCLDIV